MEGDDAIGHGHLPPNGDLYQGSLIITHRDGLPRFSARSVRPGDAGHRKACATPSASLGQPPLRSRRRPVGGRRKVLTTRPPQQRRCRCGGWMHRIACTFPPARRAAYAIPMGHDQRSLVSGHGPGHAFRLRTPPWMNIARRKSRSLHELSELAPPRCPPFTGGAGGRRRIRPCRPPRPGGTAGCAGRHHR